tara:strand:+ start:111 stop:566 length:456 start_codon:yes stop_codon:yes gene_type:complete
MKKKLALVFLLFIYSCNGYKPIFSSKDIDFSINKIKLINDDKISQVIKKKLKPYTQSNEKKDIINLEISSEKKLEIIAKDSKGDPAVYEIIIKTNIKIISMYTEIREFDFTEKFSFNNQSNKFELEQYKKSIESELTNKIFEKFLLKLRTL